VCDKQLYYIFFYKYMKIQNQARICLSKCKFRRSISQDTLPTLSLHLISHSSTVKFWIYCFLHFFWLEIDKKIALKAFVFLYLVYWLLLSPRKRTQRYVHISICLFVNKEKVWCACKHYMLIKAGYFIVMWRKSRMVFTF